MTLELSRWRRSGAATAVVAAVLVTASCSSSAKTPAASVGVPADPAATAAVAKALTVTEALKAYTFRAVQTLSGAKSQTTVLTGRASRPSSLAYTLTVGSVEQDVVRVGARTFVRIPHKPWQALTKPQQIVDPLSSLVALLNGLEHVTLRGQLLSGDVPATVLSQAKLAPAGASPGATAPVTVSLDPAGRVVSIALRLTVKAGAQSITVDESTTFGSFDHIAPITAPRK